MLSTSRGVALVFGFALAIVNVVVLVVFTAASPATVITSAVAVFLLTSLGVYQLLEVLIVRELEKLQDQILELSREEIDADDLEEEEVSLESIESLRKAVSTFARRRQEEIDGLRKLETFRKEFVGDVSHELKTPIFAAQGLLHTLLDGAVNDKAVRMKFLRKAVRSVDGLDALVQDLLVLSQIETGQIKMHFQEFDLSQLTGEVFEQFDDKLTKKNISLRMETSRPVIVYGDPQRISQVLTNLISNAIRHSFDDGEVVVLFEETNRHIVVRVKDGGEGIPFEHQGRIFERFYRVDKSRSRENGEGGTGLGLAIVKHILEGHNTRADVDSAPGRGSVFSFKLPRFMPEPED